MKKKQQSSGSPAFNRSAEQLGQLLGQVAARVDAWKQQRSELRAQLSKIAQAANGLMADLGEQVAPNRKRAARTVTRTRRRLSKATREKMAAAARKRWALRKAGKSS